MTTSDTGEDYLRDSRRDWERYEKPDPETPEEAELRLRVEDEHLQRFGAGVVKK
jgi:hypothetical protein